MDGSTTRLARIRRFWHTHRTLFWTIHSGWALTSGVAVILIARERYGFVPWVVLFLVLTWASTLFFSRKVTGDGGRADAPGLGAEATSYLTRAMYQETLFFLLPFYAYSTVVWSPNMVFTGVLGVLALLACLDLLFDRWLRTNRVVGLLFFAVVAFGAVNLLLPLVVPIDPAWATRVAAGVAVASALPLAARRGGDTGTRDRVFLGLATLVFLGATLGAPQLVPPVPLKLEKAAFSTNIDRSTLALPDTLAGTASSDDLDGLLVLLTEVFAPAVVPTHVSLVWERNGHVVHSSREIEITAHDLGFRVWDSWRPRGGEIPPGDYTVFLRASENRVFGKAQIHVEGSRSFVRGASATP